MNRLMTGELEVNFARDARTITPDHDLLQGIGLVAVDVDNVVTGYQDNTPYPGFRELFEGYRDAGINPVLLSNLHDSERAKIVSEAMNTPIAHKWMPRDHNDESMPSKNHPDMYQWAIDNVGMGDNGNGAVMIDDQLKNVFGAEKVPEFTQYIWTYPNGVKTDPRVFAGRTLEVPFGFGLIAVQRAHSWMSRS